MWNEKSNKNNQIGNWMINNIFDINKINKNDILIKFDKYNNKYYFIILDIETCNGFFRENNSIVQLSFIILGTNYIYDTYTKPDKSIPWMGNNKYYEPTVTKNTVKYSPSLKDVLLSFLNVILNIDAEPIFIAHNSSFDKSILELCFNFYNIKFKYNKWCNTMKKEIFNIRDENGKLIKSLKNISQKLLIEEKNKNIVLHNSKNDVYILYKCLLKIHECDDRISSIILKNIINDKFSDKKYKDDINNKIFIKEFKDILKNADDFCIYNTIRKENKEIKSCINKINENFKKLSKNLDLYKNMLLENKKTIELFSNIFEKYTNNEINDDYINNLYELYDKNKSRFMKNCEISFNIYNNIKLKTSNYIYSLHSFKNIKKSEINILIESMIIHLDN